VLLLLLFYCGQIGNWCRRRTKECTEVCTVGILEGTPVMTEGTAVMVEGTVVMLVSGLMAASKALAS